MELMDAIRNRRSIRKFKPDSISREDLEDVLEAACWAPSAQNLQPWYFVALTAKDDLAFVFDQLGTTAFSERKALEARFKNNPEVVEETMKFTTGLGGAPVLILAFQHKEYSENLQSDVDESIGAAIQNLILRAYEKGISSCWVNAVCRAARPLEERFAAGHGKLVSGIVLGYSDFEARPIKRKAGRIEIR